MPERHGGDVVAEVLAHAGVGHVFTTAGAHHAPILDGCVRAGIRIVSFRHQQAAVHAADGWARVTGEPGVAAVTAGPGVTNAVTAVAAAQRAESPVLVLAGRSGQREAGSGAFHELDQAELMRPVAGWVETCQESPRIPEATAAALRRAIGFPPGASFLDVPIDVLAAPAQGTIAVPSVQPPPPPAADPDSVRRAVRLLAESRRPLVLVGSALRAGGRRGLAYLVDSLGAATVLTGGGRGSLPPTHPSHVGAARKVALRETDVVLALGVRWDYRLGFGRNLFAPEARAVQAHVRAEELGRNRTVDVPMRADPAVVIEQLLEAEPRSSADGAWLERLRAEERRLMDEARGGMTSAASPIHPQRLAAEIRDLLEEDDVVIGDGGDVVGITATIVHPHRPGHWLDPGPFASLGVGAPFAIAAKLARPDSRVLAVFGDGSFGLSAMEFESAIRQEIPFVGVIGNDGAWGQVRVAQGQLYGERNAPASLLSQQTGYEKMIEALGGRGERVSDPSEIRPALERAFASRVPACVNVLLDPSSMNRASYLG